MGVPLVALAAWVMPCVVMHTEGSPRHPVAQLFETVADSSHRRAFALIAVLMVAAFSVIPFISTAFVANVGVTESQLPAVFIIGGLLTLVTTPLVGRLVDRHGGLAVFRCVVPVSAILFLVVTNLPVVGFVAAALVLAMLMASNASRMVTAMSLIMSSIEPHRRGSFMSVNSSVRHVASGLGTTLGGMIVVGGGGEPLRNFGTVGLLAAFATLASLLLAARIRSLV